MTDAQLSPLEWALEHLQLIGWPLVVTLAWKLRGAFDTLVNNHLTVFSHEVFYPFLVVGALKNRNIHTAAAFGRPSPAGNTVK